MRKIKIGIPKALLYYKYKDLWINFFDLLGCDLIISPNTNKEILNNGIKYSNDETCLSMKIFLGHVNYLKDKCDYVLVPRINCLVKDEKLCTNFSCLYDLVKNTFNVNLLNYNIDVEKSETEKYAFTTMGMNLGFSYRNSLQAYKFAKLEENLLQEKRISKQENELLNSNKLKILLVGHPYNLYDEFVGKIITNYLNKENITIIYSDLYHSKNNESKEISSSCYWTYQKEIMSSIVHYKDKVDGIINITTFPCGPDSLCNEMINRKIDLPILNIILDTSDNDTGINTRLESFIDILKGRIKVNE